MRQVAAVWFDDLERQEIGRAERWIGIHPQADEPTGRERPNRRNETRRQQILGNLHAITEGQEPQFAPLLSRLRDALDEVYAQAFMESDVSYWLEQNVAQAEAAMISEARCQALEDLSASLDVLAQAIPLSDDPRALSEARFEDC